MKTKQIIRTWYQNHVPTWETNNLVDDLFGREFLESLLSKRNKPKKENGRDLIKRKMKEGKKYQDELTKAYFKGLPASLKFLTTPPTPPVSEDKTVEGKIEPPKNIRYLNSDLKRWTKEITEAVNHLSSNAKTK